MSYKAGLKATKRTFIDPLKNLRRLIVFAGTFLGLYGFTLLNTVQSYDLAGTDYATLLIFLTPAYMISGFIFWPVLYAGFSAWDGLPWRIGIVLIQILSLILYLLAPPTAFSQGLIGGIMMAPFWCVHHIAMVQNTSKENRGYEVSLSMLITMGSSFLSAVTSGYFLETSKTNLAVMVSMVTMLGGTLCFMLACKIIRQHTLKHFFRECKRVRQENPYMIRRIVSHSLLDIPSLTTAALMHLGGISPTIMASILVVRLILMAFLAPVIGTISHKYRKHGYGIGLFIIGVGCLILACKTNSAIMFFLFTLIWGFGMRIADGSLMTGLYEMQSYASMLWSEIYMAIGRAISLIILMPLLYYSAPVYLIVLGMVCSLIYLLNRRWLRQFADAEAM